MRQKGCYPQEHLVQKERPGDRTDSDNRRQVGGGRGAQREVVQGLGRVVSKLHHGQRWKQLWIGPYRSTKFLQLMSSQASASSVWHLDIIPDYWISRLYGKFSHIFEVSRNTLPLMPTQECGALWKGAVFRETRVIQKWKLTCQGLYLLHPYNHAPLTIMSRTRVTTPPDRDAPKYHGIIDTVKHYGVGN